MEEGAKRDDQRMTSDSDLGLVPDHPNGLGAMDSVVLPLPLFHPNFWPRFVDLKCEAYVGISIIRTQPESNVRVQFGVRFRGGYFERDGGTTGSFSLGSPAIIRHFFPPVFPLDGDTGIFLKSTVQAHWT